MTDAPFRKSLSVCNLVQRSEEWHAIRAGKLTGSTFAAAAGLNPHSSRQALWRELSALQKGFEGNAFTRWGTKWEPYALMEYEVRAGVFSSPSGFVVDGRDPWLGFSPDGVVGSDTLLEIKCPAKLSAYAEVPSYYIPQVQGGMEIAGLTKCDFWVYVPPRELAQHRDCPPRGETALWRMEANQEYQGELRRLLRGFMSHWVEGVEPNRFVRGCRPKMPDVDIREVYRGPVVGQEK